MHDDQKKQAREHEINDSENLDRQTVDSFLQHQMSATGQEQGLGRDDRPHCYSYKKGSCSSANIAIIGTFRFEYFTKWWMQSKRELSHRPSQQKMADSPVRSDEQKDTKRKLKRDRKTDKTGSITFCWNLKLRKELFTNRETWCGKEQHETT